MGRKDWKSIAFFSLLWLGAEGAAVASSSAQVVPAPAMAATDCVKCHPGVVADLREAGGGHASAVECRDCHAGHPPRDLEIIPACSSCHRGELHYDRPKACLDCHLPHRPRELNLPRRALGACFDCHPLVEQEFAADPSIHARFACTGCHPGHPESMTCLDCHLRHAKGGEEQDCQGCHPPHRPLATAWEATANGEICVSCHEEVDRLIREGKTRHQGVGCPNCHPGDHGQVATCDRCHSQPHPSRMMEKYPQCRLCHGDAHTLRLEVK